MRRLWLLLALTLLAGCGAGRETGPAGPGDPAIPEAVWGEGPGFRGGSLLFIDVDRSLSETHAQGAKWSRAVEPSEGAREHLGILPDRQPGDDRDYRDSPPPGRCLASTTFAPALPGGADPDANEFWTGFAKGNEVRITIEK